MRSGGNATAYSFGQQGIFPELPKLNNFKNTNLKMCILISELTFLYIFCMYKTYFYEIMRPPEFRGPSSGEPPEP